MSVSAAEVTGRPSPGGLRGLADCGGCAAKADPLLVGLLAAAADAQGVPGQQDEDVLIGLERPDDAAVYRLDAERALVATVDFFPPVVDDAGDYGAIAAANAVSDVYAMGGEVAIALVVSGFPRSVPAQVVTDATAAAAAVVAACGGQVVGGHSIHCSEPVFGLAVLGFVHPAQMWRKGGVRPGDVMMLSKPVGTGVLITQDEPAGVRAAVTQMRQTNRAAAKALATCPDGPRAVTDVTGYGLAGHAWEMAHASGVALRLDAERIPFVPGAREAAASGVRTSADASTRRALAGRVHVRSEVPIELDVLVHDPQTSGGLLAAVRPEDVTALQDQGFSIIGSAHAGSPSVEVRLR